MEIHKQEDVNSLAKIRPTQQMTQPIYAPFDAHMELLGIISLQFVKVFVRLALGIIQPEYVLKLARF